MLPCIALRDSDQAYELENFLKNKKPDVYCSLFS